MRMMGISRIPNQPNKTFRSIKRKRLVVFVFAALLATGALAVGLGFLAGVGKATTGCSSPATGGDGGGVTVPLCKTCPQYGQKLCWPVSSRLHLGQLFESVLGIFTVFRNLSSSVFSYESVVTLHQEKQPLGYLLLDRCLSIIFQILLKSLLFANTSHRRLNLCHIYIFFFLLRFWNLSLVLNIIISRPGSIIKLCQIFLKLFLLLAFLPFHF